MKDHNQTNLLEELMGQLTSLETIIQGLETSKSDLEALEAISQKLKPIMSALESSLQNTQAPSKPKRILLVEDQPIAAEVAKRILTDLNCEVDVAPDAKEAIHKSKDTDYDLIFMDIGLPDMDGLETTKRIHLHEITNKHKRVPIVALTADTSYQEQEACLKSGMDAILVKPLFKEKAISVLNTFVPSSASLTAPPAANDQKHYAMLPDKVIDLSEGSQFFNGNTRLAKQLINTMIMNFEVERIELQEAYDCGNWNQLQQIIHKLRGAVSYCGTPRLDEACMYLEKHLKSSDRSFVQPLYEQLLTELDKVKNHLAEIDLT